MTLALTNFNAIGSYSHGAEAYTPTEEDLLTIRYKAQNLSRTRKYIPCAKEYIKLFDVKRNNCNDSRKLCAVMADYLDANKICKEFNISELNAIKTACETVAKSTLINNEKEKNRALKLLEHLNSKTKDLIQKIKDTTLNTILLLESQNEKSPDCDLKYFPRETLHEIIEKSCAILNDLKTTSIDIGGIQENLTSPIQSKGLIQDMSKKTLTKL